MKWYTIGILSGVGYFLGQSMFVTPSYLELPFGVVPFVFGAFILDKMYYQRIMSDLKEVGK